MKGKLESGQVRRLSSAVGYVFFLRLLFAARVELMPEETYYWNYSRHLDIGYLDHPPLTSWLIKAGTLLCGDTAFGVRLGALCCGVVASVFVFRLIRNVFGEAAALCGVVLAQALPFFFFSGLLMTPDAPLAAAWAAGLYFMERALLAKQSRAWLWLGVSIGLGLLSKYTIALLGVAALGFMLIDEPSRRWFGRWQPYGALGLAASLFAPVLVWNARHEWASFAFQTSRRLAEAPQFALHKLIGAAIVLITPIGVAAVIAMLVGLARRVPDAGGTPSAAPVWRLLRLATSVPLTVFFFFSLRHEVKLDWTGAPWVAALPVMAFGMAARSATQYSWAWLRAAWPPTIGLLLVTYGVMTCYLVWGLPGVGYSPQTELIPVEWRTLAQEIDAVAAGYRATLGERFLVVGMDRYAIASELAFYSGDQTAAVADTAPGYFLGGMGLMYEQWFPAARQAGKTMLLVAWHPNELSTAALETHFDSLLPLEEGALVRNGHPVRRYYYRVGQGYRPSPGR